MAQVSIEQLKQMARELLPNAFSAGADIGQEQDLIELGFDSLAMLQLFSAIEQRFEIDIFGMVNSADDYRTLQGLHLLCLSAQQSVMLTN